MRSTLLALLCAAGAVYADNPEVGGGSLYYPVKVGARRVSQVRAGDRTIEIVETVTQVEMKEGKHLVTVEAVHHTEQDRTTTDVYEVSDRGLSRVSGRQKEGEPLLLLKVGAKEGESWTADQAGPGGAVGKATYTMGKVEGVKVPAGTFKARRVDAEIKFGTRTTKLSYWFAAGVGSVKFEAGSGGVTTQTTVLKSFTPEK